MRPLAVTTVATCSYSVVLDDMQQDDTTTVVTVGLPDWTSMVMVPDWSKQLIFSL